MSASLLDAFPDLQNKFKMLSAGAWRDANLAESKINQWLENFVGRVATDAEERTNALHLLSQFIYFGKDEIMECLKVLYQENLIYPMVQELKRSGVDLASIPGEIRTRILDRTRFLGVGNPAESGTSFLYQFRQANRLPTHVFTSTCEVLWFDKTTSTPHLYPPTVDELIYLDDFCATGDQAFKRMGGALATIRAIKPTVKIRYFLLFATSTGMANLRGLGIFDEVDAVVVFDDDYRAFSTNSHFYRQSGAGVDQALAERMMKAYGASLGFSPGNELGFGDCQLLLGFHHNTPDNTIPAFWHKDSSIPWYPIFHRYPKF